MYSPTDCSEKMMNNQLNRLEGMELSMDDETINNDVSGLVDCIDSFLHQLGNQSCMTNPLQVSNDFASIGSSSNMVAQAAVSSGETPGATMSRYHLERPFVQHNYHDYAVTEALEHLKASTKNDNEQLSTSEHHRHANQLRQLLIVEGQSSLSQTAADGGGKTSPSSFPKHQTFPQTLYKILEKSFEEGYEHIISWQPHGRSFRVHDPIPFVNLVMPKYFQQKKYTSFQRQLALYGFIRLTRKGMDRGSYYHERFLRGHSELACTIHRTPVKGTGVQKLPSPETEPDFYAMGPVGVSKDTTTTINVLLSNQHTNTESKRLDRVQKQKGKGVTSSSCSSTTSCEFRDESDVSWDLGEIFSDTMDQDLLSTLGSMSSMTDERINSNMSSPLITFCSHVTFEPYNVLLLDEGQQQLKEVMKGTRGMRAATTNTISSPIETQTTDQIKSPFAMTKLINDDQLKLQSPIQKTSQYGIEPIKLDEEDVFGDPSMVGFLHDVEWEEN